MSPRDPYTIISIAPINFINISTSPRFPGACNRLAATMNTRANTATPNIVTSAREQRKLLPVLSDPEQFFIQLEDKSAPLLGFCSPSNTINESKD